MFSLSWRRPPMAKRPKPLGQASFKRARETLALRVDAPVRTYLRSEAASLGSTPSEVARRILTRHIEGEGEAAASLRQELLQGLEGLAETLGRVEAASSSWAGRQSSLIERLSSAKAQVVSLGRRLESARQTLEGAEQEVTHAAEALGRARRRLPWAVWLVAFLLGVLPAVGGTLYLTSRRFALLSPVEREALTTGVRFQVSFSRLDRERRERVCTLLGWEE
jgi:hypothetical protein